jgi:hypothetical protein
MLVVVLWLLSSMVSLHCCCAPPRGVLNACVCACARAFVCTGESTCAGKVETLTLTFPCDPVIDVDRSGLLCSSLRFGYIILPLPLPLPLPVLFCGVVWCGVAVLRARPPFPPRSPLMRTLARVRSISICPLLRHVLTLMRKDSAEEPFFLSCINTYMHTRIHIRPRHTIHCYSVLVCWCSCSFT